MDEINEEELASFEKNGGRVRRSPVKTPRKDPDAIASLAESMNKTTLALVHSQNVATRQASEKQDEVVVLVNRITDKLSEIKTQDSPKPKKLRFTVNRDSRGLMTSVDCEIRQ